MSSQAAASPRTPSSHSSLCSDTPMPMPTTPISHRAQHVAEAAQAGDPEGLARGPAARRAHRDEGQVVIRPEQRVDEADRGGGQDQQSEVDGHGRANPAYAVLAKGNHTSRGGTRPVKTYPDALDHDRRLAAGCEVPPMRAPSSRSPGARTGRRLGCRALAGREFVVLQPASREPIYLRMVETDTAQLEARLNGAPFRVIGPPRSRACATPGRRAGVMLGPGECVELI